MLKVYKTNVFVADLKEEEVMRISNYPCPFLSENMEDKEIIFNDFISAYNHFLKDCNSFFHFNSQRTPILNKPAIWNGVEEKYITERNFKPFKVIYFHEDVTENISMQELAKRLSADDFIRFLKDREMQFNSDFIKK